MKPTVMVAIAMAAMTAQAGQAPETVTIYLQNISIVPLGDLCHSKILAAEMFKTAGVHIQFRTGEPSTPPSRLDRTLVITLADHTPENDQPGALAFSLPYEGVHITVFFDRVSHAAPKSRTATVLAHVLVHEITHTLQGVSRHSATGVMKAHWDAQDYFQMCLKPFPFTADDIDLIQAGLKTRTVMLAAK
jgi:hypothetical protein